ncbi:aldo/keto reductase [Flavobacterium salilacus subsp. salilacus]|uniref:aldo/keto reductase n=1 Tax=Flavobacterium TaxID=237 RepID=UPI001074B4D2|nr:MULTISPECIES: aldo/keto reductase [Flavobacterium]KAF2519779.1 aldo/keto reductase [Flavobacterium salilacus subsp. salilacus]MBE1614322.1 aldo/keto reductase [Flavobacterium sp. SaA2.13]
MDYSSKLGLGTVQFGINYGISNNEGITPEEEIRNILSYAWSAGVNTIDTASAYGISEEVLGRNIKNNFRIVTKFSLSESSLNIKDEFERSLQRLNVDRIYGFLAHRPLNVTDNPSIWDNLKQMKSEGLIEKIGFSFNTTEEAETVMKAGLWPDLVQVPFNYLDNRFVKIMQELKSRGCEVHVRSAFLQGLFFSDINNLDPYFNDIIPLLNQLKEYKDKGVLAGMLLKYCLEKDFIDKVIIGVNTLQQLKDNLESLNVAETLPNLNYNITQEILIPSNWPKKKV